MTVILSQRAEEIVRAEMQTGRYASPDEVVNRLIEEGASSGRVREMAEIEGEDALKASLLAAVEKPTRPYRKGVFVELAQRVIADERGA